MVNETPAQQRDLDRGGINREWGQAYYGPSVGWVRIPVKNILGITLPGTYPMDLSINFVQVNVAAPGTIIILPSLHIPGPPQVAGSIPGLFVRAAIFIIDVGGQAGAFPITIQPFGTEKIFGLPSVQITSPYSGYSLFPNSGANSWGTIQ